MLLKLHSSQLEEGRHHRKAVVAHPKIFSLESNVEHYFEMKCSKAKLLLDRIKISRFISMQKVAIWGSSFLCLRGVVCCKQPCLSWHNILTELFGFLISLFTTLRKKQLNSVSNTQALFVLIEFLNNCIKTNVVTFK